ncbi:hypothetical protein WR25_24762 isoform H [Diploscapter pachys]|uniref:DNA replication complex GINS protein PSF1 n=2 Tax=Diploscapter pachys TaxID=2018661 RepID=A0A2A2KWG3_9BILA|nr:hypothetical protein WR25_24762 isoform C [Diploscapter pachys]PAV78326.1 hypothetical protein WR25_24762 isoform H [Diploscapter pachys]
MSFKCASVISVFRSMFSPFFLIYYQLIDFFQKMDAHEGVADAAIRLVQELKHNPNIIPPYDATLMRQCIDTLNRLYDQNARSLMDPTGDPTISPEQITTQREQRTAAIIYIWRCTTAYIHERACRIRSLRWRFGGILPISIRNNLSEAEIEFFNSYSSALADFQSSLGESGVNLMANTEPPKHLFVQVFSESPLKFRIDENNLTRSFFPILIASTLSN